MKSQIKEVLMQRDGMTEEEAEDLIQQAKSDLATRLEEGDPDPYYICEDWFGLEPDYIDELV